MLRAFASSFLHSKQATSLIRMNSTSAMAQRILADKVALVTASTDGIGFAIADRLAQDGAHVVVSSRKQANMDRAVAELRAKDLSMSGLVCHVAKAKDRQRLINAALERHRGINILVSNAAVNPFVGRTLDATEEVWDKILDVNVKATALLISLVVPHMVKRGGGSIVVVSSIGAYFPFPGLGPYSISKMALLGLTCTLAPELAPSNIRINTLAPGMIHTKFSAVLTQDKATEDKLLETMKIQRIGVPSDCSGIVSFLCSPDASYIIWLYHLVVAGGASSRL